MTSENSNNNDDSEDEEFMTKVDSYLSSRGSTEQGTLQSLLKRGSSLNKVVTFAMDEEEKEEARLDEERSRQELISKIQRLTDMLKDAEEVVRSERDKRKKKDKNLMKLARELKRRNSQQETDMDRIEELEEKKKYLEHHWILAQKELDQEKALRQKLENEMRQELERNLAEERAKYNLAVSDHQARIKEIQAAHAKQCDELCAEILKANLEADRLANQIRSDGYTPRGMSKYSYGDHLNTIAKIMGFLVAVVSFAGLQVGMFSIDAVCAPVMPGRTLRSRDAGTTFQAPWWAPQEYKSRTFSIFCSDVIAPTVLEWSADNKDNKVTVINSGRAIFSKRGLVKAEIEGNRMRVWNRRGVSEEHSFLWSV